MTRLYQPIWEKLKVKHEVSLVAHKALHRRIIKAVQKEKYNDWAFKLSNQPFNSIVTYTINDTKLSFKLSNYLGKNLSELEL